METPSAPSLYPTLQPSEPRALALERLQHRACDAGVGAKMATAEPLPKNPPNGAQSYRLGLIHRLQIQLETERDLQRTLCKKYHRGIDTIDVIDTTLIAISTGLGVGGVGLLTIIVAAPIVLGLEIGAAGCGIIAVAALKHDKIRVLADSKINTIASYVSKAINDGEITDQEFRMIVGELETYYTLKDEIRRSHRKTTAVSSSEKKKLIQFGREINVVVYKSL